MDTLTLSKDIKTLWAEELKNLLKELKLYQDLQKKLGDRGEELFEKKHSWKNSFSVEYFPAVWDKLAWEQAEAVYKKVFSQNITKEQVSFVEKEELLWGIKVYLDDSMVDLSFSKIEKSIKN